MHRIFENLPQFRGIFNLNESGNGAVPWKSMPMLAICALLSIAFVLGLRWKAVSNPGETLRRRLKSRSSDIISALKTKSVSGKLCLRSGQCLFEY